ncbi:MAG: ABC transporter permease [Phycisphaerales bacterium]
MSAHTPARRRTLLSALVSAQESGLVLVIALVMLGLTLRADPVTQRSVERAPAGSVVAQTDTGFTISRPGGTPTTYLASDGYTVQESPGESPLIVRSRQVNGFLNAQNLVGLATAASFTAIMAVGMTGVIVMGGIDLSIGSIYALAAVAGAMALSSLDEQASLAAALPVGLGAAMGVGGLCGLVNGAAIVGLRVHPFIITLGGMAIYRGIAFVVTKGESVTGAPTSYTGGFFKIVTAGVNPVPLALMALVAGLGVWCLARTVFGRRLFAIGGNEIAARYAGVPVGRVKIGMYALVGALAGLAAAMMVGYYGAASSDTGQGYELNVIAAAVVGGASLSGGRGSALGAMLGALIIQLIENAIVILHIDPNYKLIIIGVAIVLAVVIDQSKVHFSGRR